MIKAAKPPFSEVQLCVLPGHIFFWDTLPHSMCKRLQKQNFQYNVSVFLQAILFSPCLFSLLCPCFLSQGPHACFVQPFSCWPLSMFRSSWAEKSVFILLGLPGVEHLQTLWSISLYVLVICSTVRKLTSSDLWAGFPCSTFEWLNQKFDRLLWSLNCFANQVLCLFALWFCVLCNRN